MQDSQAEREARVLGSGERLRLILNELLPSDADVTSTPENGGLRFTISWPAPREGRPNAHGTVFLKITHEAFQDYLLPDQLRKDAEERFRQFVRAKASAYVPEPSHDGGGPEPVVWVVTPVVVRV